MSERTVSYCGRVMMGPISVVGSSGSPIRSFAAFSLTSAMNSSWTSRCTRSREPATHDCPAPENTAEIAPSAARSRFASAKTMFALLPPSSSTVGMPTCAVATPTRLPVGTEPMNDTLPTRSSVVTADPTVAPSPTATLKTPSGSPASWAICARRTVESGVNSLGLSTIALPAASGAAEFQPAVNSGAFHGVTATTTP